VRFQSADGCPVLPNPLQTRMSLIFYGAPTVLRLTFDS
jgi:hypothetical protein